MHTVLIILVALLMFATLAVLLTGVITMGRSDGHRANKLMQWRVLLQGTAIILFLIMLSLLRS